MIICPITDSNVRILCKTIYIIHVHNVMLSLHGIRHFFQDRMQISFLFSNLNSLNVSAKKFLTHKFRCSPF